MADVETRTPSRPRWGTFVPDRPDARLVGRCGEQLAGILLPRSGVREVYAIGDTIGHYRDHEGEFDLALAEYLLPKVLEDPIMVCDDGQNSFQFYGWIQ